MILSDRDICRELASGQLKISGVKDEDIGPASVDVYLDESWFWLDPLGFELASTVEIISLPDYIMGQVQGCSSIGRTGLFVQNAGLIDPGFEGTITLELFNASSQSMKIKAGQRIAQLSFAYLNSPARRPYGERGRYQGQRGATPARPELGGPR